MDTYESASLQIRIQPGASQNKIVSYENGILKLRIAAPPIEGKANRKTIQFLADILDVPPSRILIKSGLASKQKLIVVDGLTGDQIAKRILTKVN